jgi:raffinose/stachyose/melibiose transport system permease protein
MNNKGLGRPFQYLFAYVASIISLYPILLMINSSFKSNIEIFQHPFSWPKSFSLLSYSKLLNEMPYWDYFKNSAIVSIATVLLVLVFGSMVSFYIARYRFKWNGALFFFFLLGMMIPIKLAIVPLFMLMKQLSIIDSLFSLIMVYTATGLPLAVLILTAFFQTMPRELEETSRIDGCSEMGILIRVVIPLMKPALGTVLIFNFITAWNDFFFPLVFIQTELHKTIPVGMMSLFSQYSTNWNIVFAGLTLSSIPMIVIFMFASKQFMEGLTAGAVK